MKKAVVLFSGGQDSTTCLYWAKERFETVVALGFDYGQKHVNELEQAQKIAKLAGVEFIVKNLRGVMQGSSLTDHSMDSNAPHPQNATLPASFTAGRNALFLCIAASLAHSIGATDIITGVCETDYSGYPDCRYDFVAAQEKALRLGLDMPALYIHTPLMYLTKAETWKLAAQLKCVEIVRTMSLTDYNGNATMNDWGMGREDNPASVLRAKGYREAVEKGWVPRV